MLGTIIDFVTSVELKVIKPPITKGAFLPGLLLGNGEIIVVSNKMPYPGDVRHEAGHLAAMVRK